ncbi:alpha/beta hydrolase-fold protein [Salinimicrobium catena]|uniref:alpha/beta hydrolase n=1 Tax=Salinimicrobium catena TaxID=390640 RepID=UPI002FE44F11
MRNLILFIFALSCCSGFAQSTASANVSTFEIEAPQLDTIKKIWVYLPEAYATSDKRYPVLYMHDAQNLFDAATSFVGEWKVDEALDSMQQPEVIVIGLEHGSEKRIEELTPFPHEKYGGGKADAYLEFLRLTLKPHVDASFRTLPEAENTAIMGSSLGGLVSFYAILKYPETFGSAGVFSPSFWFSEEIFKAADSAEIDPKHRFYFLGGTAEDENMVPDLRHMQELLKAKEIPVNNLKLEIIEGGKHNEVFWREHFPAAVKWLFEERSSSLIFRIKN